MDAKEVLTELKRHPDKYLRMVGFDRKCDVYGEWMRSMVFGSGDQTIQGFRGSGKTVCVSGSLALLMFLKPSLKIVFIRKTDADVKEVIFQVRKMLEHPATLVLTKTIWGIPLSLTVSTQGELSTNLNNDPRGAAQLTGMGLSGSITGKHYDLIFTDDIINTKDRTSRAEREQTKLKYMELQNVKNRGGRILNTGTPWHVDDAFTLMPEPKKWDWTMMPEVITPEEAAHIKENMTPSLWAANYELRHIASDDVIFTSPKTGADISNVMGGECHVDAAYYGEDYTAFTAVQKHDGVFYCYGRLWRKHVEDVTPLIIEEVKRLKLTRLHMENNADKGYAAKAFLAALKPEGVKVLTYHEAMVKYVKIVTYLKTAWKDIVFCDGTDSLFIDQICDYTEDAEHDDAPDSAASLFQRGRFRVKPYTPKLGDGTASGTLQRQIAAVSGGSRQSYGTEKQL